MSHRFILLLARVLAASLKKRCKEKPFYMAASCIFKDKFMPHEFFLVSVLLLFFGKGQCDSSKFETLIVSV